MKITESFLANWKGNVTKIFDVESIELYGIHSGFPYLPLFHTVMKSVIGSNLSVTLYHCILVDSACVLIGINPLSEVECNSVKVTNNDSLIMWVNPSDKSLLANQHETTLKHLMHLMGVFISTKTTQTILQVFLFKTSSNMNETV